MINFIVLILITISTFYLSKLFIKNGMLLSHSGDKHQKYVSKNSIPLIGGIYLLILFTFILFEIEKYFEILILFSIFSLGIVTDLKILKSPKKRLLLQTSILILLVYISKLQIIDTRTDLLNIIIEPKIINFCFVIFCLLILVNGSNFIDGLNGLLIGYFIMITIVLYSINFFSFYNIDNEHYLIILTTLLLIFIFNVFNKLYLGDNGVYVLSVFFGLMLINYHQNFNEISPYFYILILWYPCFENLFSIIRKFRLKRSPIYPDTNHLHQLLFYYLKKKNNLKDISNNNLSSSIILLYNFFIFLISINDIYSTKLQIFTLFSAIVTYIIFYIFLFNFKYKNLNFD